MWIVEVTALNSGIHRNRYYSSDVQLPDGWAVVPEVKNLKNFPFGDPIVEKIDGVLTVTEWLPGEVPTIVHPPVERDSSPMDEVQKEVTLLKAQIKAQSDRAEFIEDCIAEMAMQVYGEA